MSDKINVEAILRKHNCQFMFKVGRSKNAQAAIKEIVEEVIDKIVDIPDSAGIKPHGGYLHSILNIKKEIEYE